MKILHMLHEAKLHRKKRNNEKRGREHKADATLTNHTSAGAKTVKSAATLGLRGLSADETIINTKVEETPEDHFHTV